MLNEKQKQYIAEQEFKVFLKPENKHFYEEALSDYYDDVGFSDFYGDMVWIIMKPIPKTKCELFNCLRVLEESYHEWWVSDFARKLEEDYPELIEAYWEEIKELKN